MSIGMYFAALLNAALAGLLFAFLEPRYAAPNFLFFCVICVDAVCQAMKARES